MPDPTGATGLDTRSPTSERRAGGRPAGGRPWLAPALVGAGALAGCVALGVVRPSDSGPTTCPFRAMTGLDCPGCGMTRGLSSVLRGQLGGAADFNLLLLVSIPLVAYAYTTWLAAGLGVRLPVLRPGRRTWIVVGALALAFTVVRNLPVGVGRYLNSDPTLR